MTQIKIKLEFERGGILYGFLNPEKAPKTVEEVVKVLPISIEAVQSRWCGREISWGIKTNSLPPKENSTGIVSKFDITYWRPWDQNEKTPESKSFESLAFYYGAEKPSYHDGALSLSVIGRISYEQEELMEEIGERIWLQGSERVRCSLA
ncbi:DUF3830 family protein [Hominifimenecus microfluidus]|uniref:DUF3830 family protein n=1 Tax=Hominifimenecus microfluidus TaxID=2885348 RepID=UPI0032BFDF9B